MDRMQELTEERRHRETLQAMRDNKPSNVLETLGEWLFIAGLAIVYVVACIVILIIKYWWVVVIIGAAWFAIRKMTRG